MEKVSYFSHVLPGWPETEAEKEAYAFLQECDRLLFTREAAAQLIQTADDLADTFNSKHSAPYFKRLNFRANVNKENGDIHLSFSSNVKVILRGIREVDLSSAVAPVGKKEVCDEV